MKTVVDVFKDPSKVLSDLLSFEEVAKSMAAEVAPFSIAGKGRALPRFIAETSQAIRKLIVHDFSMSFPAISEIVTNGEGLDSSYDRLHDACFAFYEVQDYVTKQNCVVRDDKQRTELYNKMCRIIGDLVVFTCTQFGLYKLDSGEIQLSVKQYCEKCNITPEVLYGLLLQDMEDVGQSWYAYEIMSPLYKAMMDFDPVFTEECEEELYPLTDAMAQNLLDGSVDVVALRGMFLEKYKGSIQKDSDLSPASLISMLKFD